MKNKIKLGLVCTIGGHFEQMSHLEAFYSRYPHFWITNRNPQTICSLKNEVKYFVISAHFKRPWQYLLQFWTIFKAIYCEKPSHIISTGSGRTALIPFLIAKIMKIKFIYIETYSRVNNLTRLARFILKVGHPILTQWENKDAEKITCIGPVFRKNNHQAKDEFTTEHIFVTLGTRPEPFRRLLNYLDQLIAEGLIREKVIVQAGHTSYSSANMVIFDFCSPEKIEKLIQKAKYVITQESAGIVNKCLKYGKKFIVVPRDYGQGELPAACDMEEDLQYKMEQMGYTKVAHDLEGLRKAIFHLSELKTGFSFDNTRAIR
ncbi:MAG: hypothetical protein D6813_03160, partial [Calditrichaeota bacterium]